jgi:hypothetical protein
VDDPADDPREPTDPSEPTSDPRDDADEPTAVRSPAALSSRERRTVVLAGTVPIGLAALVLIPFAVWLRAGIADVLMGAVVYGGLVGLAAAFVAVDRFHARQCPRCRRRRGRDEPTCPACGYDLQARPRFACSEGHRTYLDDGLCACGRRLQPLPTARGVGPQVRFMVKVGIWLLAFLLGVGLLLQVLGRNL